MRQDEDLRGDGDGYRTEDLLRASTFGGVGPIIVPADAIARRVEELAADLTRDYDGLWPLFIGVLKGAFVFLADLAREVAIPLEIDTMAIASYGSAMSSSGVVRIVKDLDTDLTGRHVVIVEDIVDSGLTLSYLQRNLMSRNPESLEVCTLLLKEGRQRSPLYIKYVGFPIGPDFVVGYGLDVDQRYRNLRDVHLYEDGL